MMIYGIALLVWVFSVQAESHICAGVSKCQCEEKIGVTAKLSCPLLGSDLQANIFLKRKSLEITCRFLNSSIFDDLSELTLSDIDNISFHLCPLPNESFLSFFKMLNLTKVRKLNFGNSRNEIGTLSPPYLNNLPFLEELALNQNSNLTGLHLDLLKEIPNLKNLYLRSNAIKEIYPGVFQHMPKLEVLDLSNNEISWLDSGIFRNLTALRILNIQNNKLVNLSRPLFNSVPNLEALDISGNDIVELPLGVFADLKNVRSVQANINNFKTFPKDLFTNMKKLEVVKISYHKYSLMALPTKLFADLPELTNVTLHESNVQSLFPDLFWDSPNLRTISLTGHKKITSLPRELFRNCQRLSKLELNDNSLDDLPDEFFNPLVSLRELNLSKNKFEVIKSSMFDKLTKLSSLDISHNALKRIDILAFDHLRELRYLDLSYNFLDLGSEQYSPMKHCISLENLLLSNNRITKIFNDWIVSMTTLKRLDLRNNNFTVLEDISGSITSDSLLIDLSSNNISIVYLEHLETIGRQSEKNQTKENNVPKVILSDNPIACNCSNYDLILYANMKLSVGVYNLVEFVTKNLTCPDTDILFNKISPARVECATNNCPSRCSCVFSPFFSRMVINCASEELRQLPQSLPSKYGDKKVQSIHLILRNNLIESLPDNVTEEYKLVEQLDLAGNKLSNMKPYSYFSQLKKLDLSNNQLQNVNNDFIEYLSNKNLSSVNLSNNSWMCDCSVQNLHGFLLNKHEKVVNSEGVLCKGWTRALNKVPIGEICSSYTEILFALSIVLGVLGLAGGIFVALYYKYEQEIKACMFAHPFFHRFVTEEELDVDKTYDAFVSYAKEDDAFVMGTLIPGLEKNFTITHHMKDFLPGEWIHSQILKSVQESRRTIIVLSKDFLKSYWGALEFRTAYTQAVRENRTRVIILIYGEVPAPDELDNDLKEYMSLNTYIKWGDPWFWKKLNFVLPHAPSQSVSKKEIADSRKWMNEFAANSDKRSSGSFVAELIEKS